MYMKRMLEIGKAENGFVVECKVPIKPKNASDQAIWCDAGKQYVAKDLVEVTELVGKLMPLLDGDFTSDEEFDAAYEKAVKQ